MTTYAIRHVESGQLLGVYALATNDGYVEYEFELYGSSPFGGEVFILWTTQYKNFDLKSSGTGDVNFPYNRWCDCELELIELNL